MSSQYAITNVAVDASNRSAVVTVDQDIVDQAALNSGNPWMLRKASDSSVVSSQVYEAIVQAGNRDIKVFFSPPLIPGYGYTISADVTSQGWSHSGSSIPTAKVDFTSPTTALSLETEWSHGLLRAISRSAGQLIQEFTGKPETILVKDISPGDKHIFVESTLAFPDTGYVVIDDLVFYYKTKTASSFRDVKPDHKMVKTQPAHQVVSLSVKQLLPEGTRPFLTASSDGLHVENNGADKMEITVTNGIL